VPGSEDGGDLRVAAQLDDRARSSSRTAVICVRRATRQRIAARVHSATARSGLQAGLSERSARRCLYKPDTTGHGTRGRLGTRMYETGLHMLAPGTNT